MSRRSGFTLIEMLLYIGFWTLVSGSLMGFMYTVLTTASKGAAPVLTQKRFEILTDRIRLDITNSRRALPSWEKWKTGEDVLVLETEENGELLFVIHLREANRWKRLEVRPGKKPKERGNASIELKRMDFKIIPVEGSKERAVSAELEAECGWGKSGRVRLRSYFTGFPRGGNAR